MLSLPSSMFSVFLCGQGWTLLGERIQYLRGPVGKRGQEPVAGAVVLQQQLPVHHLPGRDETVTVLSLSLASDGSEASL